MKKTKKAALVALSTTLPLLTALPASADPPPRFTFSVAPGWGCPNHGVSLVISPPSQGEIKMILSIAPFKASVGKDVPAEEARKKCAIYLIINHASDYTWGLKSISTRGEADLEPGTTGEVTLRHWYPGGPAGAEISRTINAPTRSWWLEHDGPPEFLPCGQHRGLNLETRLQVTTTDPAKAGWISLGDEFDSKTAYTLAYKTCKP
ncbi:DUF4360 domain-containing protein [Actinomadura litoris]|uniref:DUF4360 domain-containing protein n=1 Tax=Actinomadura litoris TaxID=2678616 RepID=A0A7K1KV58_9ACTN|nr:DUF4360 domain-containing protein [Actinomadura litoris]MUN35836.1 DUF4360 domain-containing protein [Actinomadura litoris]